MECLGFKPSTSDWKAQTNPLCYGGLLVYLILAFGNVYCNRANPTHVNVFSLKQVFTFFQ